MTDKASHLLGYKSMTDGPSIVLFKLISLTSVFVHQEQISNNITTKQKYPINPRHMPAARDPSQPAAVKKVQSGHQPLINKVKFFKKIINK